MHYFIANGIVERLGLESTVVSQINIEMLDRNRVYSSHMLIREITFLTGQEMVVDLIVMDMPNFDVIPNMDFLSKYRVEIDYRKKNVRFSLDNGY